MYARIILFIDQDAKYSLQDPLQVDKLISGEIPPKLMPHIRCTVLKHMIHRPCDAHTSASCFRDGQCSKRFPKPFRSETGSVEGDYYVNYKRRSPKDGGEMEEVCVGKGVDASMLTLDNSCVVPYSPDLLRKFRTHLNVEFCISKVGSIKYLFKYVCKGSDRVTVEVRTFQPDEAHPGNPRQVPTIDEIQQYQHARYISASEVAWILFSFPMVEHQPPVERLEVHIEGHHIIYFQECEHNKAVDTGKANSTKLMTWLQANESFSNARNIPYVDFPKYFRWNKGSITCVPRAKYKIQGSKPTRYDFTMVREQVVGKIYNIRPREREGYFLRTLLLNRAGAISFADMRFYAGVQYPTLRETFCAMGLL